MKQQNPDQIVIKQKHGTWIRFLKLFPKCRLPVVWLLIYIVLEAVTINTGISETDYTAQLFSGDTSSGTLAHLIFLIVMNLVLTNLVVFTREITSARINRNMRGVLLEKVMRLPMRYFKNEEPREAIYRIVQNAIVIDSTIMLFILPVATALYKAVSVFSKVFTYDFRLSLILIAFIPVNLLIAFIFGRINFSLSERDASINASLMKRLSALVTNIPLAKAFAREDKEAEKGGELTQRLYKLNIKSSWLSQLGDLSDTLLSLIQALIMVFTGMTLLKNGGIDRRAWISFFMFSSLFQDAISEFKMYWNNIKTIQGGADKVAEIMNAPEEDKSGEPCESLHGDIEIKDLRFGYDEQAEILKGVNCTFKDNTVTALLGVNGCGKTTLISLVNRLYSPDSGRISIDGEDISRFAVDEYRKHFVTVSQNSMIFSGTIRENIRYGNPDATDREISQALKDAGAYDFVTAMSGGLEAKVEEYGSSLSGGQRQRLALARAFLSKAHYVILDEPVSAMDAIATSDLMKVFKKLSENRCMIIITHTPAVLSIAENAVVIENGTVSCFGPVDTLRENNAFLKGFCGEGGRSDG